MDDKDRAEQVQRTNNQIDLHTKKWGGPTKAPFLVRTGVMLQCLCGLHKGISYLFTKY